MYNHLILSRLPREAIFIGDDLYVRLLDTRGQKARIEVCAPRDVEIWRNEIKESRCDAEDLRLAIAGDGSATRRINDPLLIEFLRRNANFPTAP